MAGPTAAVAQTSAFTYQGALTDAGAVANGRFDFEFRLFNAATSGTQIGSTFFIDNVPVTNGIFSVVLDFGSGVFPGANRFLEIAVRPGTNTGALTRMAPLQQITPTPYAIRSERAGTADVALNANALSAACIGCVPGTALANGSVTDAKVANVAGSKITGTVPVAAIPGGSTNYIQNRTTQQTANFSISGIGTASEFTYATPQTAYYAVNEAAFTSRDGVSVSTSSGNGGVYPTTTSSLGLAAPINLPHGATVTNIRFIYIDNSTNTLTLFVHAHFMTGGYMNLATHDSPGPANPAVQTVDVPVSPGWVVDNQTASLEAFAYPNATWMNFSMQVRGVILTYTMPRPAR